MEDYDTWIRPFAQIFLMPSVERQLKNKRVTPGMTWLTRAKSPEFRFNWEFTVMKKSKKEMMLVLQSKFNPAYVQQHTKPSSVPQPEPSIAVP